MDLMKELIASMEEGVRIIVGKQPPSRIHEAADLAAKVAAQAGEHPNLRQVIAPAQGASGGFLGPVLAQPLLARPGGGLPRLPGDLRETSAHFP